MTVQTGLQRLINEPDLQKRFRTCRAGLLANHASVTRELVHAIEALSGIGISLELLFGPEHGIRGYAQDMESVEESIDPLTGIPLVSLYGNNFESLAPSSGSLRKLDVIFVDLPDIGTRYYTYAATAAYLAKVAFDLGEDAPEICILDRPNPINGLDIEGNIIPPHLFSFVGAIPIANRHGLTLAEIVRYAEKYTDMSMNISWIEMKEWERQMWYDETGLPWVLPSPNMPTLDTATIYPGLCLLEATNLSEGRGTTRPFEFFGAPYINGDEYADALNKLELPGVYFRPMVFKPGFQKWKDVPCQGVQVHIQDRKQIQPYRLGLAILWLTYQMYPGSFGWREQPYEFVRDIPAIDLLCGTENVRLSIECGDALSRLFEVALSGEELYRGRLDDSILLYPC